MKRFWADLSDVFVEQERAYLVCNDQAQFFSGLRGGNQNIVNHMMMLSHLLEKVNLEPWLGYRMFLYLRSILKIN